MSSSKASVEDDARSRAAQTLSDGKPIMDRGLLLRCAEEIEHLKAALRQIAEHGQARGGIWARQQAHAALERRG
jgi:hypothetical protein